jgi:hypothetical protein
MESRTMKTLKEQEYALLALQRRFEKARAGRNRELMEAVRREYRRRHQAWVADKAQGRLQ